VGRTAAVTFKSPECGQAFSESQAKWARQQRRSGPFRV
jgi:hypothetical protein